MNGFTYHNIFDTKGIEYLAIIVFFILLIPFWLILNRRYNKYGAAAQATGGLDKSRLRVPAGYYHTDFHTWSFLDRKGIARVGADDLLVQLLGRVEFRNLRTAGEKIMKGDAIAEIQQDGKKLSLLSPVSGEIVSVNSVMNEKPGLIREDPYGEGWLFRIKPNAWLKEIQATHLADDSLTWMQKELDRFVHFLMASSSGSGSFHPDLVMQDGGLLREHPLSECPEEVWKEFQSQFLGTARESESNKEPLAR